MPGDLLGPLRGQPPQVPPYLRIEVGRGDTLRQIRADDAFLGAFVLRRCADRRCRGSRPSRTLRTRRVPVASGVLAGSTAPDGRPFPTLPGSLTMRSRPLRATTGLVTAGPVGPAGPTSGVGPGRSAPVAIVARAGRGSRIAVAVRGSSCAIRGTRTTLGTIASALTTAVRTRRGSEATWPSLPVALGERLTTRGTCGCVRSGAAVGPAVALAWTCISGRASTARRIAAAGARVRRLRGPVSGGASGAGSSGTGSTLGRPTTPTTAGSIAELFAGRTSGTGTIAAGPAAAMAPAAGTPRVPASSVRAGTGRPPR